MKLVILCLIFSFQALATCKGEECDNSIFLKKCSDGSMVNKDEKCPKENSSLSEYKTCPDGTEVLKSVSCRTKKCSDGSIIDKGQQCPKEYSIMEKSKVCPDGSRVPLNEICLKLSIPDDHLLNPEDHLVNPENEIIKHKSNMHFECKVIDNETVECSDGETYKKSPSVSSSLSPRNLTGEDGQGSSKGSSQRRASVKGE